jgi:hypothetical protein
MGRAGLAQEKPITKARKDENTKEEPASIRVFVLSCFRDGILGQGRGGPLESRLAA